MQTGDQSAEALREEILAQARKRAGEIIERARQEAENLMSEAVSLAKRTSTDQGDSAHAEGVRRRELILAGCPIEVDRLRITRIESLLDSIREEAGRRLRTREGFDYKEVVSGLAALGIVGMTGSRFVLRVSSLDRTYLGNGLAGEVALRADRDPLDVALVYEESITDAGVIVEDGEARQRWDNRLLPRLERMWPDLRRQLALQTSLVTAPGSGGSG